MKLPHNSQLWISSKRI